MVNVDAWGCVPLPAKSCYVCRGTCKAAPLLQCDYCPLLFHQVTYLPSFYTSQLVDVAMIAGLCLAPVQRSTSVFFRGLRATLKEYQDSWSGYHPNPISKKMAGYFVRLPSPIPKKKKGLIVSGKWNNFSRSLYSSTNVNWSERIKQIFFLAGLLGPAAHCPADRSLDVPQSCGEVYCKYYPLEYTAVTCLLSTRLLTYLHRYRRNGWERSKACCTPLIRRNTEL